MVLKAIDTLGQPVLSDVEPCKLALAQFLEEHAQDTRFFFVAQGADALFGLGITKKIKVLELLGKIPGSALALRRAGRLLKPVTKKSRLLLKGGDILSHSHDPHFFIAPTNTIAVYSDIGIARRSFGDETIRNVLEYRRNWEEQYLNSTNNTEKVHIIDLLSDSHEVQAQSSQLFLSSDKEQIYPFMDDDITRMSLAFRPEMRYIQGLRTKPLLKDILEQHGLSAIARRPKGGSTFTNDLYAWMHSGPLREMVLDIERPDFMSKADFERLLKHPEHSLWSLLTFDIFKKRILKRDRSG
jgi:hypothetical protein